MKFEENPFRVLQVSIYDTKSTIIARADDLSFAAPDREDIINQARDILLNPKKRIAAEMCYFDEVDIENLFALAGLNKLICSLNDLNREDKLEAVIELDALYVELDAEEIRGQINAVRAKAKFPAVQDTVAIKSELKNIRYEIREKIQGVLKNMTHGERVKLATEFAGYCNYADDIGIVAEDFFDSYRLELNPFFDETTKQIISLLSKIKINPHAKFMFELEGNIKAFVDEIKPLDEFSIALGTNNFDESKEIFYSVRDVAIQLFNVKNFINDPLILTRMLEKNFSYLPTLAEVIRKDIKFLEDTKARRPTQSFLDAKATLDKIQTILDKNLHFKKGFEQANLDFYEKIFKPGLVFDLIRISNNPDCKPDELKKLNHMATVICIKVGNAMTWTRRADLALELFQKALFYAEASGNIELISLSRKRVDEWRKINEQIATNSDKDSSGCIWWIIIIGVIIYFFK